jgi:hypothetical protein
MKNDTQIQQDVREVLAHSAGLVSVDENIDAIAREALEEARRREEAARYRNQPGPIVTPKPAETAPK